MYFLTNTILGSKFSPETLRADEEKAVISIKLTHKTPNTLYTYYSSLSTT